MCHEILKLVHGHSTRTRSFYSYTVILLQSTRSFYSYTVILSSFLILLYSSETSAEHALYDNPTVTGAAGPPPPSPTTANSPHPTPVDPDSIGRMKRTQKRRCTYRSTSDTLVPDNTRRQDLKECGVRGPETDSQHCSPLAQTVVRRTSHNTRSVPVRGLYFHLHRTLSAGAAAGTKSCFVLSAATATVDAPAPLPTGKHRRQ